MVSVSEAILVDEVSLAGSGAADEEGVSDPRLIEQPEATSANNAVAAIGPLAARRRVTPDQKCATGMAIDRNTHAQTISPLVARHAAKYSRPKQKRGPEGPRSSSSV
jgi:hypothetical protein